MSENILINWFEEKINNCYHIIKDDGDIIWVYDKNYIRKKKLAEIIGKKLSLPTTYKNENILFYQDQVNKFFECDYEHIWLFLMKNCKNCQSKNSSDSYDDVQNFIKKILNENNKLKEFTPFIIHDKKRNTKLK